MKLLTGFFSYPQPAMNLAFVHTRLGQNNGNTTDTAHISFLIWCGTNFFTFNTASILLGMDSYNFEQSLPEFYTNLLEEHPQVVLEMLEVGICSSL
jgi:hypothetical protein